MVAAHLCHRLEIRATIYVKQLGGIRNLRVRHDLETFKKRLKALKANTVEESLPLTEDQLKGLERFKEKKQGHGEIEPGHSSYLLIQDTYYIGTIKGVGRSTNKPLLIPIPKSHS